jgi:hypothetical protein
LKTDKAGDDLKPPPQAEGQALQPVAADPFLEVEIVQADVEVLDRLRFQTGQGGEGRAKALKRGSESGASFTTVNRGQFL